MDGGATALTYAAASLVRQPPPIILQLLFRAPPFAVATATAQAKMLPGERWKRRRLWRQTVVSYGFTFAWAATSTRWVRKEGKKRLARMSSEHFRISFNSLDALI